jgi:hypothetical protein
LNSSPAVAACGRAGNRLSTITAGAAKAAQAATTSTTLAASAAVTGVAAVEDNKYDVTTETSSPAVSAESSPAVSALSAPSAVRANSNIFAGAACRIPTVTASHSAAVCDAESSLATTRLKLNSSPAVAALGRAAKGASTETAVSAATARAANAKATRTASAAIAGVAAVGENTYDVTTVTIPTGSARSNGPVSAVSAGSAVSANVKIFAGTALRTPAVTASHNAVVLHVDVDEH